MFKKIVLRQDETEGISHVSCLLCGLKVKAVELPTLLKVHKPNMIQLKDTFFKLRYSPKNIRVIKILVDNPILSMVDYVITIDGDETKIDHSQTQREIYSGPDFKQAARVMFANAEGR